MRTIFAALAVLLFSCTLPVDLGNGGHVRVPQPWEKQPTPDQPAEPLVHGCTFAIIGGSVFYESITIIGEKEMAAGDCGDLSLPATSRDSALDCGEWWVVFPDRPHTPGRATVAVNVAKRSVLRDGEMVTAGQHVCRCPPPGTSISSVTAQH
jgi:hypothetical protein